MTEERTPVPMLDDVAPVPLDDTPPTRAGSTSAQILAAIAVIFALHWGREFLVPVLSSIVIAYTLKPIVERLHRWQVPRSVGALLVVGGLCGALAVGVASLRDEALSTLQGLPTAARHFSVAVTGLYRRSDSTVRTVEAVARELQRAGGDTPAAAGRAEGTPPVVIAPPLDSLKAIFWSGSITALSAIGTIATSLLLVFFLLQAGDAFRRKLVRVVGPTLSARRATVEVLNDINAQIQRYMFMLLITNTLLALTAWAAYAAVGLDNAAIWAIVVAVLHLIPYVGALLSVAVTAIAAFAQFQTFPMTLLVGGVTLALATIIGMVITPWISGRQARMNPTAIFLALLFFGWLWGAFGLLLAIPVIAICKVIAERIDRFHAVAELLGD